MLSKRFMFILPSRIFRKGPIIGLLQPAIRVRCNRLKKGLGRIRGGESLARNSPPLAEEQLVELRRKEAPEAGHVSNCRAGDGAA